MSLCHTVYVIVSHCICHCVTLYMSLCSHCVRHCAHTQAYSYPLTIEELAIVQHYVTKETNTASSSREDVKDDILILQL